MQRVDAYIGHWESDLNLQIDANLTKKIYRSVTNCIALDVICNRLPCYQFSTTSRVVKYYQIMKACEKTKPRRAHWTGNPVISSTFSFFFSTPQSDPHHPILVFHNFSWNTAKFNKQSPRLLLSPGRPAPRLPLQVMSRADFWANPSAFSPVWELASGQTRLQGSTGPNGRAD